MRKFLTILLILIIAAVGITWLLGHWSFSDGQRAGTISKLSYKGYVFKTYEGELNEGGYSGETGALTRKIWDFSVLEIDSVTKKLDMAMKTGERVTLKYEERVFTFPWNGDTKYFITDVEFQQKPQPAAIPLPEPKAVEVPATPTDTTKK
jgi:hypothetical protein